MSAEVLQTLQRYCSQSRWEDLLSICRYQDLDCKDEEYACAIMHYEAFALAKLKRYRDAWPVLNSALSLQQDSSGIHDLGAQIARELGLQDQAESHHIRACHFADSTTRDRCLYNHAVSLHAFGRFAEARTILARVGEDAPIRSMVNLLFAHCSYELSEHERALTYYQLCVADEESEFEAQFGLANCLAALGKVDESREIYADLPEKEFGDKANFNIANALLREGRVWESSSAARMRGERSAPTPELRCLHAKCLIAMGANEAAAQILDGALEDLRRRAPDPSIWDEFVATRAELFVLFGEDIRAENFLLNEIKTCTKTMKRCFAVLGSIRTRELSHLRPFSCLAKNALSGWVDELRVLAPDFHLAESLVKELYDTDEVDLTLSKLSLAQALDAPKHLGVYKRHRYALFQ